MNAYNFDGQGVPRAVLFACGDNFASAIGLMLCRATNNVFQKDQ
jgi:hypothetical protein